MRKRIFWVGGPLAAIALVFSVGCDRAEVADERSAAVMNLAPLPDQPPVKEIQMATAEFKPARRLAVASGEFVRVESPGYACPTLADVNRDGRMDLAVGQFTGGKIKIYYGIDETDSGVGFRNAEWILSGGKPAEVPGIS